MLLKNKNWNPSSDNLSYINSITGHMVILVVHTCTYDTVIIIMDLTPNTIQE